MPNDPREILGLPPDADEALIRRRYLELVRAHPPDRDPERFAAIREAYDRLREPGRELARRILGNDEESDSLEALAADLRALLRDRLNRIPTQALLSLAE